MGFFSSSKKEDTPPPEWLNEAHEIKTRLFSFLEKLEIKMQELCEAAIPELIEIQKTNTGPYNMAYGNMLAGIKGQLENIRQKVYDVYEDKVEDFYQSIKSDVSILSPHHEVLTDFRTTCSDRRNAFEGILSDWNDALDKTEDDGNLEEKYQNILKEYESIKNKFKCKQCGGNITIDKIFFLSTYITCSYCQSQNTFEPSTEAKGLEYLGRQIAEQRTAHLLLAYNEAQEKERELYHQRHQLKLDMIGESDKKVLQAIEQQIKALEIERDTAIKEAPALYVKYLRAMFDEWNKIVPDLTVQNNKFHDSQLAEFMKSYT
jgi:RNA polymerase-binding transcription factor DksA